MARGEAEGHIRFEDAKRGSICCIYTDYYTIYDIFSTSDVFTVLAAILLATHAHYAHLHRAHSILIYYARLVTDGSL